MPCVTGLLLLFLYNTGARAQEVVDLRVEHLDFQAPSKVRLHGKGDKWRLCPSVDETVKHLEQLLARTPDLCHQPCLLRTT